MKKNNVLPILFAILCLSLSACHSGGRTDNTAPEAQTNESTPAVQTEQEETQAVARDTRYAEIESLKQLEPATREERDAIRDVYGAFKKAVLSYKGADAVSYLSKSSLEYYENILVAAKTAIQAPGDFKILEKKLSPSMHVTVTLMLKRLSHDYILSASAEQLYETAFNQGWIGYKTLTTASVDNLTAYEKNGKRYLVGNFYYMYAKPDEALTKIGFEWEDNLWKIDLVPVFLAVDYDIRMGLIKKGADETLSFEETIKNTNEAENPENWSFSTYKNDAFGIRFPREPLYVDNQGERIYTSKDYRYGQFDVRIRYYDAASEQTAFHEDSERKKVIQSFMHGLEAKDPKCVRHEIHANTLVSCEFDIPGHDSKGMSAWIFTPDRQYQLLNIARSDMFDPKVAETFMNSFAFGEN